MEIKLKQIKINETNKTYRRDTMNIGFIGCGNMASAMIKGMLAKNICKEGDIICSTKTQESNDIVKEKLGVVTTLSNKAVVQQAQIIFLAVKPFFYQEVIDEIKEYVKDTHIIITLAPGKTLQWIEETFKKPVKCIRTMPNTPAMVLEGVTSVTPNKLVSTEEVQKVCTILEAFGKAIIVEERLINSVIVASGSSPAFVFMFIEALADAAVKEGMPRKMAYEFVAQGVLGSAKMVLETGRHPGELKDMVCSPAGSTIEGVRVLEQTGMRSSIMEGAAACAARAKEM